MQVATLRTGAHKTQGERSSSDARIDAQMLAGIGFATLGCLPLAIVLIGPLGVTFVNQTADALLAKRDGLWVAPPHRLCTERTVARQLDAAIVNALIGRGPTRLLVRREQVPPPLLLAVHPLRESPLGDLSELGGFAAILIHDPMVENVDGMIEALASLYALTSGEAALAVAIADGRPARQIADRRGVSVKTVRSQIQRVLSKTACRDKQDFIARFGWIVRTAISM